MKLILFSGIPGTGKSTLSEKVARKLHIPVFSRLLDTRSNAAITVACSTGGILCYDCGSTADNANPTTTNVRTIGYFGHSCEYSHTLHLQKAFCNYS
ncbi:AAA family ATPase [Nostoc sp. FACHB-190]|uniref:AAA family ATPase n=1 Tax=Nostoc sp. FACHB-190 TaxID=2692838 RepID=UPI001688FC29|nr:AAA family ATPase [Nostoc sp. FACHB-190]